MGGGGGWSDRRREIFITNPNDDKITKVKVKVTPEQATKAQKGSKDITLLFLNLGVKWGGWSKPRPGRFTPGKDPVPIV
jgi:hypothetical protein